MDVETFSARLPQLFDDFPASERPRDERFRDVLAEVPGLAEENNLALLNLAVSCLDPGESYVEVGSYRGTSLVGALLGNDARAAVAIDDFSFRDGDRSLLEANLARFGIDGVEIVSGDFAEVLSGGALDGRRVGAYYYDAAHSYEAHVEGLRLIEPYLGSRALLIVDDADWEQVERATRDYLAGQPRARMLFDIEGDDRGARGWWKGVHVLAWDG